MSGNDLIIDEGFAVLNDFRPGAIAADDGVGNAKSDPIPRCPFASYRNALSISSDIHRESLLNDCSLVFTARTKDDSDGYSTGSTFFLPCLMKPRCALEALAERIFRAHVNSLGDYEDPEKDGKSRSLYDPERSGAEWWTLVLDTPSGGASPPKDDDDDCDEEEDDEVGIHFDADYGLEEQLPNFMLHPRVATITYLSDTGVPTLILNKRSPPPSDHDKKSLNGSINKAWLSHPRFGKHVAFDGRFLHGAPGKYFQSVNRNSLSVTEPKSKRLKVDVHGMNGELNNKRITFLVNIWLNHCPLESEPLDEELVDRLTTPWNNPEEENDTKSGDAFAPPFDWNVKNIDSPDATNDTTILARAAKESGVENAVICNRHVDVIFGASMEDFHKASILAAEGGGSIPIDMEDGVFSMRVGNEVSSESEEEHDE